MFKRVKETLSPSNHPRPTESLKPIIRQPEDDLPPELKYALKPGRTYRNFPDDAPESAIPLNCGACGINYDGLTQTHCRACGQGRSAYKIDVTDQPYYTLPPKKEGDAPSVRADELIPTFGGGDIILGQKTEAPCAIGDKVKIGMESSVAQIAGNRVFLDFGVTSSTVVARDHLMIGSRFSCEDEQGGLTAKQITLEFGSANIEGKIVLPDGGSLSLKENNYINRLIVGADTSIFAGDRLKLRTLIILGSNVKIALGEDCFIGMIESNHNFQLQTGRSFSNDTRTKLRKDYNLAVEISDLINRALNLNA